MDLRRARAWSLAWIGRLRARLEQVELRVALALFAIGMLALGFAEIADAVLEEETQSVDRAILLALHAPTELARGPAWMREAGRDITALGGFPVLGLLSAAVSGYLWLLRERRMAVVLLAGVCGAGLGTHLLKEVFDRPRPDLVPHLSEVASASFPSGHASMSAATYLILGMLIARVHRRRVVRAYIASVAVLLVLLVGVSRVYVGVHWPTDVLAGWVLGTLWAIFVWIVATWRTR